MLLRLDFSVKQEDTNLNRVAMFQVKQTCLPLPIHRLLQLEISHPSKNLYLRMLKLQQRTNLVKSEQNLLQSEQNLHVFKRFRRFQDTIHTELLHILFLEVMLRMECHLVVLLLVDSLLECQQVALPRADSLLRVDFLPMDIRLATLTQVYHHRHRQRMKVPAVNLKH